MTLHSIDHANRLYLLEVPGGFSSLGFDVAEDRRRKYVAWLRHGDDWRTYLGSPTADTEGTAGHYHAYADALKAVLAHCDAHQVKCPVELEQVLKGWEGCRVEVITRDKDGEHRERFWVGRSTGPIPVHIAVHSRRSLGGPQVHIPHGATVKVVRLPLYKREGVPTGWRVGDLRVKP